MERVVIDSKPPAFKIKRWLDRYDKNVFKIRFSQKDAPVVLVGDLLKYRLNASVSVHAVCSLIAISQPSSLLANQITVTQWLCVKQGLCLRICILDLQLSLLYLWCYRSLNTAKANHNANWAATIDYFHN